MHKIVVFYRFLVYDFKNPEIHKNIIMESRNASFFEDVFPCLNKEDEQIISEEDEMEPRRSKRARVKKSFGPDFLICMVENEQKNYCEAVISSEGPQWKEAIKS